MSEIKDGGPAFPIAAPAMDPRGIPFNHIQGGMTLRDKFAESAMLGEITYQGLEGREVEHIAAMAYEMADAMLRARSQS